MSYDWSGNAEGVDTMPLGEHDVRIVRIQFLNREGNPLTSTGGDPQIRVVFQDQEAREVGQMYTLSDKAGFKLAQLFGCFDPPMNLQRMKEDGVLPIHFANQEYCLEQLMDRRLRIKLAERKDKDGKSWPDVQPLKPSKTGSAPPPAAHGKSPQSLPFSPPPTTPPSASIPPAAASPPPPPITAPPAAGMTKEQAWAKALADWRDNSAAGQQARNEKWTKAVLNVCGPSRRESSLTPADWQHVAEMMEVPF